MDVKALGSRSHAADRRVGSSQNGFIGENFGKLEVLAGPDPWDF